MPPSSRASFWRTAWFVFLALREKAFGWLKALLGSLAGVASAFVPQSKKHVFAPRGNALTLGDLRARFRSALFFLVKFSVWTAPLAATIAWSCFFWVQTTPGRAPLTTVFDTQVFDALKPPFWDVHAADDTLATCAAGGVGVAGSYSCLSPLQAAGRYKDLLPLAIAAYRSPDAKRAIAALAGANAARAQALLALTQSFEKERAFNGFFLGLFLPLVFSFFLLWVAMGLWPLGVRFLTPSKFIPIDMQSGDGMFRMLSMMAALFFLSGGAGGVVVWGAQTQTAWPKLQELAINFSTDRWMPPVGGSNMALFYQGPPAASARSTRWPNALRLMAQHSQNARRVSDDFSTASPTVEPIGFWKNNEITTGDAETLLSQKAPRLTPVERRAALSELERMRGSVSDPMDFVLRGTALMFIFCVLWMLAMFIWQTLKGVGRGAKNATRRLAEQGSQIPLAKHEREELARAIARDDGEAEAQSREPRPARQAKRL